MIVRRPARLTTEGSPVLMFEMGSVPRVVLVALTFTLVGGSVTAQDAGAFPPGTRPITMEDFRKIQEMELRKRQIQKMDEEIATQRAIRQAEEAKAVSARVEAERPVPISVPVGQDAEDGTPLMVGIVVALATLGGAVVGFAIGRFSKRAGSS
jgi:hypothetical protein